MDLAVVSATIPEARRLTFCTGLAWALEPVLSLDTSPIGRRAASEVKQLVAETWQVVGTDDDARDLELRVRDRDELVGVDLDVPESWRSDLLNVLQFGLRCARTRDERWLVSALAACQDLLYFLQQAAGESGNEAGEWVIDSVADWARADVWLSDYSTALSGVRSRIEDLASAASVSRSP
ncbi:hypothetical protein [Nocardioides nitrophenolicus]|uniref:hypothetical protein n=1 Tax=Nocardioides nitrophenolicus TaxID=60489 RepID=UPI001958B3C7|nr:hypothetical protein [Nocardioides nitrophenolicus]MBM7518640.1 hypothetical protein [Nocardioides nitrophenolicus]